MENSNLGMPLEELADLRRKAAEEGESYLLTTDEADMIQKVTYTKFIMEE